MDIRKIIHIDMDAFFASVEQRDNPALRGKPVAVGGSGTRGVVAAASYEARVFGVRSAMPSVTASRLCPNLIFVKHRFDVYKTVSRQIREIFFSYTDLVEPLSLDEAYLDVTENKMGMPSATIIAKEIRKKIKEEVNLTASAGISFNKFLAKIASDINKPDGIALIRPEDAESFIERLPIEKFHGIGKVTASKMHSRGIFTGADIKAVSKIQLAQWYGKTGLYFYDIVRGNDQRKVKPDRIRKSISAENTFHEDASTVDEMLALLRPLVEKLAGSIKRSGIYGKTVTLKIKYHDFRISTRSKTYPHYIQGETELMDAITHLLHHPEIPPEAVRLLGVGLSKLNTEETEGQGRQLTLDF